MPMVARARAGTGLSPRLRGSRLTPDMMQIMDGSIPASAGEPGHAIQAVQKNRVYPRVCGGASSSSWKTLMLSGLSPRLRGSQLVRLHDFEIFRSIPASAGEPGRGQTSRDGQPVYPRVCGGAKHMDDKRRRMRVYPRVCGGAGSSSTTSATLGVYPRVCGGASIGSAPLTAGSGLSPRLRGAPVNGL